jgi:hypothetical protein
VLFSARIRLFHFLARILHFTAIVVPSFLDLVFLCCTFFSGFGLFLICHDLTFRCDDNAKVKEKMIYASSKDELKKRLVGVATEVQANDKAGFDMKDVVERVSKV